VAPHTQLHCPDRHGRGDGDSVLEYKGTIGTLAIWSCTHRHEWTEVVMAGA
jgi:hypothetical protein